MNFPVYVRNRGGYKGVLARDFGPHHEADVVVTGAAGLSYSP
jgi:hypothetical protein